MNVVQLSFVALLIMTGCATQRSSWRAPADVLEDIALDGRKEAISNYSRGDGFWSTSYFLAADGSFERRFLSDDLSQVRDSDTIRGNWRLVDERLVETEWKESGDSVRHEKLRFVAIDGKLGFVEESHRQTLESQHVEWRQRKYIFRKTEPNKAPEPTPTSVTPPANAPKNRMNESNEQSNAAGAAPAAGVAHL